MTNTVTLSLLNRYYETENGESKEKIVSNDIAAVNISSDYDNSVTPALTTLDQKANADPSLQPTSVNSLSNGEEITNDPSPEASQNDTALKPKPYSKNQPSGGRMIIETWPCKLPGYEYENYGTIEITYQFPSGKQNEEHPNPGQHYHGTNRIAYIPDSTEGRKVVQLLFKVDRTNCGDGLVWNGIDHKTNIEGGPHRLVILLIIH